jgi:hypothetical protein
MTSEQNCSHCLAVVGAEPGFKLLVVLICLGAILQRVLPLAGINWLWKPKRSTAPNTRLTGARFDCIAIGMRFVSSLSCTNYSVRRSSTVQSTKCEDR